MSYRDYSDSKRWPGALSLTLPPTLFLEGGPFTYAMRALSVLCKYHVKVLLPDGLLFKHFL